MSRALLLVVWWVIPALASAQKFAFEYWHEGKVVLESGDTLRGQLKYNMAEELVQYKDTRSVITFSSRKVIFFEIFDETVKRYRTFYSLPYALTGQYRAPTFFELLTEGKMTLFSREKLETRTSSSSYYVSYTRLVLVNKFFLLKGDNDITEAPVKKNDFIDMMGNHGEQVAKYAKENRLDFDDKYDLAQIVGYYNSLFR